jgi:hypothetical protein
MTGLLLSLNLTACGQAVKKEEGKEDADLPGPDILQFMSDISCLVILPAGGKPFSA